MSTKVNIYIFFTFAPIGSHYDEMKRESGDSLASGERESGAVPAAVSLYDVLVFPVVIQDIQKSPFCHSSLALG